MHVCHCASVSRVPSVGSISDPHWWSVSGSRSSLSRRRSPVAPWATNCCVSARNNALSYNLYKRNWACLLVTRTSAS
eukprot:7735081-Lingulodinium_polyedra.AAC.1